MAYISILGSVSPPPFSALAIKQTHSFLTAITSFATDQLDLVSDAAILEGDFKDWIRTVAGTF